MEVTPAASDSGHVKWSFFIRASNIWNRVFGTLPSSDFSFLWKFCSFFRQPKRRVCLPLPLPPSSRDSSIVNVEASQVFDVLRDIIENMFFNLHNIQKNLQFWQSRAEGSYARNMYFMICERGPRAFYHGTMQFLSESLAKDSSAHHLSHSASAYIHERITVLSILRTSLAAFLAKVYLEVERSGEEIVRDPKKSVPSLLVTINVLFSKLEDAISHLQSSNSNYSSVDGSNSLLPIFQKLPEVNREGSQWTDCELQDAINLVYQNLQQLNTYLSDIVAKHQKPRKVTLYWLQYTCGTAALSLCSFWLLRHSSLMGSPDIDNWIQEARSSTVSFFNDHVEQPLLAIRDELFDTFRKRHKGMMELEEVQLTSNSLHRMLLAFTEQTKGQKIPDNASDQAMLEIVMARYEKELMHPIQNLLSGELARALLIQVQKLKLDIETAMLELDQILKANEINFAILAALPAFFLSLLLLMLVRAWFKQDSKAEGRGRIARIQRRLLVVEVEKTLIQYQTYMDQGLEKDAECMFGLLLYSLDRLYHAVERHAKDTGEWQCLRQDIVDLAKPGLQTTYKLIVTSRMDRVYDCLLPSLKRQ